MNLVVELHGAKTGNCIRAAIALEEAGVPYTVRVVDLAKGAQRSQSHLSLNPLGMVPTLVERSPGGASLVLSQSNAILMHVAGQNPGRLLPTAPGNRAHVLERFFYFVTDVIAPSHAGFFLKRKGIEVGPALFSQLVIERVEYAEAFVTASPYMAGNEFSIADIVAVTIIDSVQNELEWDRYPMLRDWFDGVIRRPSVRRAFSAFGT